MSDRLTDIRARWELWPKFDIGDDGELYAGDVRLGDIDAGEAGEAIAAAPEDVAWLVAEVERLRAVSEPSAATEVEPPLAPPGEAPNSSGVSLARWRALGHALTKQIQAAGWPGGGLAEGVEWLVRERDEARGALDALALDHARAVRERDEARVLLEQSLAWATPELRVRIRAALGEGGSGE